MILQGNTIVKWNARLHMAGDFGLGTSVSDLPMQRGAHLFAHHRDIKVYMNYNTFSIQSTYAYFSFCSQVVDLALSPMRSEWYLDGHARSPNTALIIGDRSYLPHWLRWSSAANIAAAAICKNRHPWHTTYDVCTYSTSFRVPYMKKSTPHQDIVFEHPIHAILWTTNSTG